MSQLSPMQGNFKVRSRRCCAAKASAPRRRTRSMRGSARSADAYTSSIMRATAGTLTRRSKPLPTDLSEVYDFRLANEIGVMGAMFQSWKFLSARDPSVSSVRATTSSTIPPVSHKFASPTGSAAYDHCSPIIGLEFKKPGSLRTNRFTLPSRTVPHVPERPRPSSIDPKKGPALTAAGADSFASFLAQSFVDHHHLSWYHPAEFAAAGAHCDRNRLPWPPRKPPRQPSYQPRRRRAQRDDLRAEVGHHRQRRLHVAVLAEAASKASAAKSRTSTPASGPRAPSASSAR